MFSLPLCPHPQLLTFHNVSPTHSLWLNSFLHEPFSCNILPYYFPHLIHLKGTVPLSGWKMQIEFVAIVQEVRESPRLIWHSGTFFLSSAILSILGMAHLVLTIWLQQFQPSHGDRSDHIPWRRHFFLCISVLGKNFMPMPKLLGRGNWVSGMCSLYNGGHSLPSRRKVGVRVGGNGFYVLKEWCLPKHSSFIIFSSTYSSQASDPFIPLNWPSQGQ